MNTMTRNLVSLTTDVWDKIVPLHEEIMIITIRMYMASRDKDEVLSEAYGKVKDVLEYRLGKIIDP